MSYCTDQLNVTFEPGQRADLSALPGVTNLVQVFPEAEDDMVDWYIVYVEEDKLESLLLEINALPEVLSCEKIAIRKLSW